jgi:pimeloyl-ACP methyl ester carboxylesterase
MENSSSLTRILAIAGVMLALGGYALAQQQSIQLSGTTCSQNSFLHCPDNNCSPEMMVNEGPTVEMKTRRTYFLDYPCDLKPGEKVTFILSLHGAGSYGNWQRNYFPLMDYKDKYRLVIATPNSPTRIWSEADDQYLRNIVTSVIDQIGRQNIKAFWLVGHSQGGLTSNRLVRTDFFKDKVDGWLSLSGGRLGGNPGRNASFGPPRATAPAATPAAAAPGAATGSSADSLAPNMQSIRAAMEALRQPPSNEFSFIYETGRREMDDKGLPETSDWATRFNCGPRRKSDDIVDTKAGYVYDGTRQNPPNPSWGLQPAPGKAELYVYPDCKNGRVVADIVRIDKGHTEGLEPKVTEELIKLMVSAKGGKLQETP